MLKRRLSLATHAALLAMFGVAAGRAQVNQESSTNSTPRQRFFGTQADQDALDRAAAKRERKAEALAYRAARGAFRQTATPRA